MKENHIINFLKILVYSTWSLKKWKEQTSYYFFSFSELNFLKWRQIKYSFLEQNQIMVFFCLFVCLFVFID